MIDRFLTRIAGARSFAGKLWVLTRPYWYAEQRQRISFWGFSASVKECWIARGLRPNLHAELGFFPRLVLQVLSAQLAKVLEEIALRGLKSAVSRWEGFSGKNYRAALFVPVATHSN